MPRMTILMPIIQLLILSSAATFEVKSAKVYVVDDLPIVPPLARPG